MADGLSGRPKFEAGTVRSFINWHLQRGSDRETIIPLAMKRFPHQGTRRLNSLFDEVHASYQAARNLLNRQASTRLHARNVPNLNPNTRVLRVGVTFTLGAIGDSPQSHRGYTLDLDRVETIGQLKKNARKAIMEHLWQHYGNRLAGRRNLDARIKSFEIQTIEAL